MGEIKLSKLAQAIPIRKKRNDLTHMKARQGRLSVMPALIVVFGIQMYSIVVAFLRSFTNWDGLFKMDFVGFQNYTSLFADGQFWKLLGNNFLFMLYIPITMFLGLIISVLLYQECPGWKFFRAVICLPQILSAAVIGYLLKVFFGYAGPINAVLDAIGLGQLITDWLGKGSSARAVILFALVWVNLGWQAMIFTGGLSSIDPSVLEAATLDGSGYWHRLFHIIIPMMARVIEYSIITSLIFVFTGMFALIFSITNGGPGYETTTIDYMIYLEGFFLGTHLGKACALAMILLVIVMIITVVEMRISNKLDDWS